jgi:hypothetical protein
MSRSCPETDSRGPASGFRGGENDFKGLETAFRAGNLISQRRREIGCSTGLGRRGDIYSCWATAFC